MNIGNLRKKATTDGFVLIEPPTSGDADKLAKSIVVCKGVRKVFVTSGDFGFLVHTKECPERSSDKMLKAVKKASGRVRARVLKGHFVYAGALIKTKTSVRKRLA